MTTFENYWDRCIRQLGVKAQDPKEVARWCYDICEDERKPGLDRILIDASPRFRTDHANEDKNAMARSINDCLESISKLATLASQNGDNYTLDLARRTLYSALPIIRKSEELEEIVRV